MAFVGEVAPHPLRRGKTPPPHWFRKQGARLHWSLALLLPVGGGVTHYASPGKPDEARVPGRGLFAGAARRTSIPASWNAARRVPFAGLPLEEPGRICSPLPLRSRPLPVSAGRDGIPHTGHLVAAGTDRTAFFVVHRWPGRPCRPGRPYRPSAPRTGYLVPVSFHLRKLDYLVGLPLCRLCPPSASSKEIYRFPLLLPYRNVMPSILSCSLLALSSLVT